MFLCSSLEPGRDGVGDYTRRLAAELIRKGHFSIAVSLNDKYVSDKIDEFQQSESTVLQVLRLPATWEMKIRLVHVKKYIDDFNPDWLSLQFVIFGFHRKGLPFGLSNQLALLGKGRRWHIMFHELWLGMEVRSSKKHFLWGNIQRLLIKSLISSLKPAVIHTNTALYQQQISKLGFIAQNLPLFGNIPNVYNNDKELSLVQSIKTKKSINLVLFGHIHPKAPIDDFTNEVAMYGAKNGLEIILIFIGRCGSEQGKWADKWAASGMKVNILGEQPVNNVSKVLGTATMGISTTPIALIGKSGSVAAMHEHGLSVVCVPCPWQPKILKTLTIPAGILSYQKGNLESIFTGKFDTPIKNNVSIITDQFISALFNSV
ncbi:MAG: hypothetical protein JWQ63_1595 [Mucilaginibacter sp.]|nr:hypothetical protein [Mucilaginibacter sp.]